MRVQRATNLCNEWLNVRRLTWLLLPREAYYQAGKQAEWPAYRSQLMQTHAHKDKLMGLLKQRDLE